MFSRFELCIIFYTSLNLGLRVRYFNTSLLVWLWCFLDLINDFLFYFHIVRSTLTIFCSKYQFLQLMNSKFWGSWLFLGLYPDVLRIFFFVFLCVTLLIITAHWNCLLERNIPYVSSFILVWSEATVFDRTQRCSNTYWVLKPVFKEEFFTTTPHFLKYNTRIPQLNTNMPLFSYWFG